MRNSLRSLISLSTTLLAFSMSGCGGGGGGGSSPTPNQNGNPPPPNSSEITEQQFFNLTNQSGVWRNDIRVDFDIEDSLVYGGVTYPYSLHADVNYLSATLMGNTNSSDYCGPNGPESADDDYEDEEEYLDPFVPCEQEQTRYFQTGANSVQIQTSCNGLLISTANITRVANASTLDFGSLSFNSSDHPNLATNSNVCGSISYNASQLQYSNSLPGDGDGNEDVRMATIELRAPYGDHYLHMLFDFWGAGSPAELLPRSYSYVSDEGDFGEFRADIQSAEFNSFSDSSPTLLPIQSGTVTISFASATAVQGSYSLRTNTGDNITGNFDLDLND